MLADADDSLIKRTVTDFLAMSEFQREAMLAKHREHLAGARRRAVVADAEMQSARREVERREAIVRALEGV